MPQEVHIVPIALNQQRLWFLDQLEPGSSAYNIHAAYALSGPLSPSALEQALNEIVRRHETLRTTFREAGWTRRCRSSRRRSGCAAGGGSARACPRASGRPRRGALATEEARRPFDLARGPLLRAALLRLGDEEHVLLLTHAPHRLRWLVDGRVRRASCARSTALSQWASPRRLPRAADPVRRLTPSGSGSGCKGEVLEKPAGLLEAAAWRAPAVLELPTDRPRPPVQTFRGARHACDPAGGPDRSAQGLEPAGRASRCS